ncbi:aldo/keto reductase, partial [Lactobacillus reuteri]|nr:aldo/keto reductase [Limosilactobacillus reuteri]
PDVTPNGVFYLPPTGWLTSFYNPPFIHNSLVPIVSLT